MRPTPGIRTGLRLFLRLLSAGSEVASFIAQRRHVFAVVTWAASRFKGISCFWRSPHPWWSTAFLFFILATLITMFWNRQ